MEEQRPIRLQENAPQNIVENFVESVEKYTSSYWGLTVDS